MKSPPSSTTFKKTAKSGKTRYGTPLTLRENSQTKIEIIPHFIPRSESEVVAVSIKKYSSTAIRGNWVIDESSSFSLSHTETSLLLSKLIELQTLVGAKADQKYITIPLDGKDLSLPDAPVSEVVTALLGAITNPELKQAVTAHSPSENFVQLMKTGLRVAEMKTAVGQLRTMLTNAQLTEHDYQKWFDLHYWVFGNAYIAKDEIKRISRSDNVDLLLQQTASGLRDIVELKRPQFKVLDYDSGHKQYYFSREATKAIGQCDRYLNVFSDVARKGLIDEPDIVAHHPRAIIVIGRSTDWDIEKKRAFHSLNSRLHGITLMTFDHVFEQATQMLKIAGDGTAPSSNSSTTDLKEEIPF